MPDLIEKTEYYSSGPWLLDYESLQELDRLIDEEWRRLVSYREEKIRETVEAEISEYSASHAWEKKERRILKKDLRERIESRYGFGISKSLTILYSNDRRLEVESFVAANRESKCSTDTPTGFILVMRCADVSCSVQLPYTPASIRLHVAPDNLSESRELFTVIRGWIESKRPPLWQRIWTNWSGFHWLLLLFYLVVSLQVFSSAGEAGRSQYRKEAVQLLKDGLSDSEKTRALELILSLEARLVPDEYAAPIPTWFWWSSVFAVVIGVLLSFAPKVILGLGEGQAVIKRWQTYAKFVFVSIPSWFVGTFFLPKIADLISALWQ